MHSIPSFLLLGALLVCSGRSAAAQSVVDLASAVSFVVLGSSTVTNTGPTVVYGDLGLSPGGSVTGFPPGTIVGGAIFSGDAVAAQARFDATAAYTSLMGELPTSDLTGQNLGGLTLGAGVYSFDTSAGLGGTLVLDAVGNPNARFHFLIGTTLTTASASLVSLLNGAQASNVFWQVGSSATLGTGSGFAGSILANSSVTANTGASVAGRLFALTGAVTLDSNIVGVVPEPASVAVFTAAFVLCVAIARRRKPSVV